MKVTVFGATGFIGSYLIDELLAQGHLPVVLVRPGSEPRLRQAEHCRVVSGDISDTTAVRESLSGCDAAIYNIGILREYPRRDISFQKLHFEGARRAMEAAAEQGVQRFLLMSANGVRADGTPYQRTKYMAEQYLTTTELHWTIFRPSVVFGDPRGKMEFATQLYDQIVSSPLPLPLFHTGVLPTAAGRFALSPIHVTNVASVFVQALGMPETVGRTYALGGPQDLDWKTILATIAQATSRQKLALPVPAWNVRLIAGLLERFEWFPVTADQIDMLMEGNTCDSSDAVAAFQFEPVPFDTDSLAYLRLTRNT
jgi:NADH dehydrogenase